MQHYDFCAHLQCQVLLRLRDLGVALLQLALQRMQLRLQACLPSAPAVPEQQYYQQLSTLPYPVQQRQSLFRYLSDYLSLRVVWHEGQMFSSYLQACNCQDNAQCSSPRGEGVRQTSSLCTGSFQLLCQLGQQRLSRSELVLLGSQVIAQQHHLLVGSSRLLAERENLFLREALHTPQLPI